MKKISIIKQEATPKVLEHEEVYVGGFYIGYIVENGYVLEKDLKESKQDSLDNKWWFVTSNVEGVVPTFRAGTRGEVVRMIQQYLLNSRRDTAPTSSDFDYRTAILEKIADIKEKEGGFIRGMRKWQAFQPPVTATGAYIDACDVVFENMTDEELLNAYGRVMIRFFRQM